jgi:uncharacterized protein (DUF302 family)
MPAIKIAYETTTGLSYDDAIARCREALAAEGFGVLTEIDIKATLKKKLDVDVEPHVILGACHPPSAYRVLTAMPEVSVMLPCNVTVSVEKGKTMVRAMNPEAAMGMLDNPEVVAVATEVGQALQRVLAAVE